MGVLEDAAALTGRKNRKLSGARDNRTGKRSQGKWKVKKNVF